MKYIIDKEHTRTFIFNGKARTLGRIIALRDVHNPHMTKTVERGQQGGYVEICDDGSEILSQDGESWICKGCMALKTCYVGGNGLVAGGSGLMQNTTIINDGVINGSFCEPQNRVSVCGSAVIDSSIVYGDVNMMGKSMLRGCQHKEGYLRMEDESKLLSCVIYAKGHGIALKNKQAFTNLCLDGEGYEDDSRMKFSNLERVK